MLLTYVCKWSWHTQDWPTSDTDTSPNTSTSTSTPLTLFPEPLPPALASKMVTALPASHEPPRTSTLALSTLPSGKASVAPPKLSAGQNVELNSLPPSELKLPLEEDVMQLARLGEISPIQKLFEDGRFDARFSDGEGITPLHVRKDISCLAGSSKRGADGDSSGRRSTTTMLYASF